MKRFNQKIKCFKKWLAICLLIAIGLLPATVGAQSKAAIQLEIEPAVFYLDIKPGQQKKYQIKIKQAGQATLTITPILVDFKPDGETGQPILQKTTNINWVKISSPINNFGDSFTLTANSSQTISLTISPPKQIGEQEFPLAIIFRAAPTSPLHQQSGAQTQAMIVSNLIIGVRQQKPNWNQLVVEKIKAPWLIDSFRPLDFQILIGNQGKSASPISGKAIVKNFQQKSLRDFTLINDIVLANSTRLARQKSNQKITDHFIYDQPFLLGIYTIEVRLNDPAQQIGDRYVLRQRVIAAPISIIFTLLLFFNIYVIYYYFIQKKLNK